MLFFLLDLDFYKLLCRIAINGVICLIKQNTTWIFRPSLMAWDGASLGLVLPGSLGTRESGKPSLVQISRDKAKDRRVLPFQQAQSVEYSH